MALLVSNETTSLLVDPTKVVVTGFNPIGLEQTINKGQPNGYAGLDSDALVPESQLPKLAKYKGKIDVSTLVHGVGDNGDIYTHEGADFDDAGGIDAAQNTIVGKPLVHLQGAELIFFTEHTGLMPTLQVGDTITLTGLPSGNGTYTVLDLSDDFKIVFTTSSGVTEFNLPVGARAEHVESETPAQFFREDDLVIYDGATGIWTKQSTGVTKAEIDLIAGAEQTANKEAANGYAGLDTNSKLVADLRDDSVAEAMLSLAVRNKLNNTIPSKTDATVPPTASNDENDSANASDGIGFQDGSLWVDQTGGEAYRCIDASAGAAIWILTTLTTDELATIAVTGNLDDAIEGLDKKYFTRVRRDKLEFVAEHLGDWDASTNTPTLGAGGANNGDTRLTSVKGTQDIGDGSTTFEKGDLLVFDESVQGALSGNQFNATVQHHGGSRFRYTEFNSSLPLPKVGQLVNFQGWTEVVDGDYVVQAIEDADGQTHIIVEYANGTPNPIVDESSLTATVELYTYGIWKKAAHDLPAVTEDSLARATLHVSKNEAAATDTRVSGDEYNRFKPWATIGAAIAFAQTEVPKPQVIVYGGTYEEEITIDGLSVKAVERVSLGTTSALPSVTISNNAELIGDFNILGSNTDTASGQIVLGAGNVDIDILDVTVITGNAIHGTSGTVARMRVQNPAFSLLDTFALIEGTANVIIHDSKIDHATPAAKLYSMTGGSIAFQDCYLLSSTTLVEAIEHIGGTSYFRNSNTNLDGILNQTGGTINVHSGGFRVNTHNFDAGIYTHTNGHSSGQLVLKGAGIKTIHSSHVKMTPVSNGVSNIQYAADYVEDPSNSISFKFPLFATRSTQTKIVENLSGGTVKLSMSQAAQRDLGGGHLEILDDDIDNTSVGLEYVFEREASTGLLDGGLLSIGTPNTTFSISDGQGVVSHVSNPNVVKHVSWTGKTNIPVTEIATQIITFVAIDEGGNVIQQGTPFTNVQKRDYIVIGVVVHVNQTTVNTINQEQHTTDHAVNQLHELAAAIGFFNVSGNIFGTSGADMTFDKSVGDIFAIGSNYDIEPRNPNQKTLIAETDIAFQYRFQDGTNRSAGAYDELVIDPDSYDVGGVETAVPNNKFTVQWIFVFISGDVKLQMGQKLYNTMAEAIAGIGQDDFVVEPSIEANGLLRGFLIVEKGTTDLTDTSKAKFISAEKFGSSSGSGGTSVSSLQQAYGNSVEPEIQTDSIRQDVTYRAWDNAQLVLSTQNVAGTNKTGFYGDGRFYAEDLQAVSGKVYGTSTLTMNGNGAAVGSVPTMTFDAIQSFLYSDIFTIRNTADTGDLFKVTSANTTLTTDLATVTGNLTVNGDFLVEGTTTTINTDELNVEDNIITLNHGFVGATPTLDAGLRVNRGGTLTDYHILWDETLDFFTVGEVGSEQIVATRTGTNTNNALTRFDTATNSLIQSSDLVFDGSDLILGNDIEIRGGTSTGLRINATSLTGERVYLQLSGTSSELRADTQTFALEDGTQMMQLLNTGATIDGSLTLGTTGNANQLLIRSYGTNLGGRILLSGAGLAPSFNIYPESGGVFFGVNTSDIKNINLRNDGIGTVNLNVDGSTNLGTALGQDILTLNAYDTNLGGRLRLNGNGTAETWFLYPQAAGFRFGCDSATDHLLAISNTGAGVVNVTADGRFESSLLGGGQFAAFVAKGVADGTALGYGWRNSDAAADERAWDFIVKDNLLQLRSRDDVNGAGQNLMTFTRGTGTVVDSLLMDVVTEINKATTVSNTFTLKRVGANPQLRFDRDEAIADNTAMGRLAIGSTNETITNKTTYRVASVGAWNSATNAMGFKHEWHKHDGSLGTEATMSLEDNGDLDLKHGIYKGASHVWVTQYQPNMTKAGGNQVFYIGNMIPELNSSGNQDDEGGFSAEGAGSLIGITITRKVNSFVNATTSKVRYNVFKNGVFFRSFDSDFSGAIAGKYQTLTLTNARGSHAFVAGDKFVVRCQDNGGGSGTEWDVSEQIVQIKVLYD